MPFVEHSETADPPRRDQFEALWSDHHKAVFDYCRRRVADQHTASDVAAETFVVAWRRLGDVPAVARPWLLGVARRLIANHQRGARRREALFARMAAEPQPAGSSEDHEDGQVSGAFNRLGIADRDVLSLVVWEELRPGEAAEVLGISSARFSVRLHRAKRRLRAELERMEALSAAAQTIADQGASSSTSVQMEAR